MNNDKKKKKKKVQPLIPIEAILAGMRGNRNRMPTLGAEYVVKRKKR